MARFNIEFMLPETLAKLNDWSVDVYLKQGNIR